MATLKLKIPYRSQNDPDAQNHNSDCGPTCLSMLLGGLDIDISPDEIYQYIPRKIGRRQFTLFSDLQTAAANAAGLTFTYKRFNHSQDALAGIKNSMMHRKAIIALVNYKPWMKLTGNPYQYAHFVNIVGVSDTHVFMHDPIFGVWPKPKRDEGSYFRLTHRQFMDGWGGFDIMTDGNWPFSCLITDHMYDYVRKPVGPTPKMPKIDETMEKRINALAAYQGMPAPDLNDPIQANYWVAHVGQWGKEVVKHKVQSGDSYSSIAYKYYNNGALWPAIQKYNGLINTWLFLGQTLEIPKIGPTGLVEAASPDTPAIEMEASGKVPTSDFGGPKFVAKV